MTAPRKTKPRRSPPQPAPATVRARIAVKIQPSASSNRVVGHSEGEWKLTLTAPAVEGRANRACVEFLARLLRRPRSAIRIVRGETARHKILEIDGLQQSELESKLEHASAR